MYRKDLVKKTKKQLEEVKNIKWRRRPQPTPRPKVVPRPQPTPPSTQPTPPANKTTPVINIEHMLNDPMTESLVKQVDQVPSVPSQSKFLVRGYKGGGFARGTLEYQAANSYVTIAETIGFINSLNPENAIPHWPRTSMLNVMPRAGSDLNAFYDGRSLQFYYYDNPAIGGTVYTVDSADVVSHECGHAILDSYRPDLWNAPYIETGAFHEAFGDFCALMHALSHDEMIAAMLEETNGDLTKSNVVSKLAEQFGRAIWRLDSVGRSPDYLRDAVNSFNYVNPSYLKEVVNDDTLGSEIHNFSRVMLGAIYDAIVAIYNSHRANGVGNMESVKFARDTICTYIIKAVKIAPINPRFYESVLKSVLWIDKHQYNGRYFSILQDVFSKRGMAIPHVGILSNKKCPNHHNIVKSKTCSLVKLNVHFINALSGHINPLYNVSVEVSNEHAHFYDKNGHYMDSCDCSDEECVEAAKTFVDYLNITKNVGSDKKTPWEVKEGKLIRTRTCCR